MKEELKKIYRAFGGKLVGRSILRVSVCEVVALMPEKIQNYVTKNCWFLGSDDDAWGLTFTGNDIRDQHLIVLSDELFKQSRAQIHYTIAHEIGHMMLGHRNSILERQPPWEIASQEREADKFAKKYIK